MSAALKSAIQARAREAGFDDIGFVKPDAIPEAARNLELYLAAGHHGDMAWMTANADRRGDPATLWPEVRSIIVLGMNYGPASDPLAVLAQSSHGAISVYARARDYHDLIKKRLKQIARWLHAEHSAQVKVFVDTAPVMEKPLAQAAGLGWQGKHTNLVSRRLGSWSFLGSIFTDLDLSPDRRHKDSCGSCRACLDICPTGAFPDAYLIDARRCISYLTIEFKGHIPVEFRAAMGNRIYGCDDCLAVCPWNKYAHLAGEHAFHARDDLNAPLLEQLAGLDDAAFRQLFSGSPIKRIGRDRFVRNVMIAIGNSKNAGLVKAAQTRLQDASPLVRAMAVWAFVRLAPRDHIADTARQIHGRESDEAVLAEWRSALQPQTAAP